MIDYPIRSVVVTWADVAATPGAEAINNDPGEYSVEVWYL
jgi:hypothetical protein